MQDNIKPGTLIHVGYVGQIGMFLSYNEIEKTPTTWPSRGTCNVLIEEDICKVWVCLIKPVEEAT